MTGDERAERILDPSLLRKQRVLKDQPLLPGTAEEVIGEERQCGKHHNEPDADARLGYLSR